MSDRKWKVIINSSGYVVTQSCKDECHQTQCNDERVQIFMQKRSENSRNYSYLKVVITEKLYNSSCKKFYNSNLKICIADIEVLPKSIDMVVCINL